MAVSSKTKHPREAMDYARFTASPEIQSGVYFQSGGQPGHRSAWTDKTVNSLCNGFFEDTLQTLDESLCRPKGPGYMAFQDAATPIAHDAVAGRKSISEAAREMANLWETLK
jgi:multiple sugar transport system substrate-binding protein